MTTSGKLNPKLIKLIEENAQHLRPNNSTDYDLILRAIGDAQIVMIGEASHGITVRDYRTINFYIEIFRLT